MTTALDQFWDLVSGASTLNPQAFVQINVLPLGGRVALMVVLGAALAQGVGQGMVLALNRVRLIRSGLSLTGGALLVAIAYSIWILTIGLISFLYLKEPIPLGNLARAIGLSYAPQMLSFLIALPYLGIPIAIALSLWTFLAIITSLPVLTPLNTWEAFSCAVLGWIVVQWCQRTLGRPLILWAHQLTHLRGNPSPSLHGSEPQQPLATASPLCQRATGLTSFPSSSRRPLMPALKTLVAVGIGLAMALLLSPSFYQNLLNGYIALSPSTREFINLSLISLIALSFALLLSPLETPGWWAGWYGDEELTYPEVPVRQAVTATQVSRYVLYLDGVSQGSYEYLPDVELFLNRLADKTPDNVLVVKGMMPYVWDYTSESFRRDRSDRPLKHLFPFFWQIRDSISQKQPERPLSLIIRLRNLMAAAVAADPRTGPMQSYRLAQGLFENLISFGYPLGSQRPITVIGYSGGGQMAMGVVPYLAQGTGAPIEVISLAGIISSNRGLSWAEQVYHLVGERDGLECLGALLFPGRWPIMVRSPWNLGKRRGKITAISLGPVGHEGVMGPLDDYAFLPDGRSYLGQTVELIAGILLADWTLTVVTPDRGQISNYDRYRSVLFNQPESYPFYYPTSQPVNPQLYRAIAPWMGRLILPKPHQRHPQGGVLWEVHHAEPPYGYLVGQVVNLQWNDDPPQAGFQTALDIKGQAVTRDVNFVDQVRVSQQQGNIHPSRLNHWSLVSPLESLAGARPVDDVLVKLINPVVVQEPGLRATLRIDREPVQISGRFYGLVTFLRPLGDDRFLVRHYRRDSGRFDGPEESVYLPAVVPNREGVLPSTTAQIERSPLNPQGWWIYGAKNDQGEFVVQAIAPYQLFAVTPDRIISGKRETKQYIDRESWSNCSAKKGTMSKVLLVNQPYPARETGLEVNRSGIKVGDRLLVIHLYGGIGGRKAEFAPMGIHFGHFAYGVAQVVTEPITGQWCFQIEYRQVYTHNTDGLIAGSLSWERYSGDRQWGWMGSRPLSDTLIKFSPITDDYDFDGLRFSVLDNFLLELDIMCARYRIGDGTGTTFVTPIHSCVQDSTQALYRTIQRTVNQFQKHPNIQAWLAAYPNHQQTQRIQKLAQFGSQLRYQLTPLKMVRPDWQGDQPTLGEFAIEKPIQTIYLSLASWRSLLPKLTHDATIKLFLDQGAIAWTLRTNQIGGFDPEIEPVAPTDFGLG